MDADLGDVSAAGPGVPKGDLAKPGLRELDSVLDARLKTRCPLRASNFRCTEQNCNARRPGRHVGGYRDLLGARGLKAPGPSGGEGQPGRGLATVASVADRQRGLPVTVVRLDN